MPEILPISGLIPTRKRRAPLERVLRSLAEQPAQPVEIVVVDASVSDETEELCRQKIPGLESRMIYRRALVAGAIEQRNQAMSYVTQEAVLFLDDDIILEPECVVRLWRALNSDAELGGVNAMIINQRYLPPGIVSRTLFRFLNGRRLDSYAGRCIGPAVNLLPEDREDLPEVQEVEWLNTTCTLYRRAALPDPPFATHAVKGGLGIPAFPQEDLALSLRVRNNWKLANARTARIYHDSQPGIHKANVAAAAKVELINRHYLMTNLLGRRRFRDHLKLVLIEVFGVVSVLRSVKEWMALPSVLSGKLKAITVVLTVKYPPEPTMIGTGRKLARRTKPLSTPPALLPVSALIPTLNRRVPLARMLESLALQSAQPVEVIVVDASKGDETLQLCEEGIPGLHARIIYNRAAVTGAAAQRNQAIARSTQETLLFVDDDIVLEEDCLKNLWEALQSDERIGGVNSMIINQCYYPPGLISRTIFRLLHGKPEASFAGKCIGPAFNLLPEDRPDLPACVPVEWLNMGCTLYRRAALPDPPFPSHFQGYSFMEDLALSLTVGKKWKLANARLARVFHDSQPGDYKSSIIGMARMELVNRHYVMTQVLNRRGFRDYAKLALLETFFAASGLDSLHGWIMLPAILWGKLTAIPDVVTADSQSKVSPSSV